MIQEDYSDVSSDADRNSLRQKAAIHALGRELTPKELSDLKFSKEHLGDDYFNRYHPTVYYQSWLHRLNCIDEVFGTDYSKQARIHFYLSKTFASIQFFSNQK